MCKNLGMHSYIINGGFHLESEVDIHHRFHKHTRKTLGQRIPLPTVYLLPICKRNVSNTFSNHSPLYDRHKLMQNIWATEKIKKIIQHPSTAKLCIKTTLILPQCSTLLKLIKSSKLWAKILIKTIQGQMFTHIAKLK